MSAIENATWLFMVAGGQTKDIGFGDSFIDPERVLRRDLLHEEYDEYLSAEIDDDLVEVCDALADMIVVALGTLYKYVGWNVANEILNEVAASNLSTVVDGKVLRRDDGKILKVLPERSKYGHIKWWNVHYRGALLYKSRARNDALTMARRLFYVKDLLHD